MEMLKKFFKCYFRQDIYFDELDSVIQDFKGHPSELQLITELHQIIQSKNYSLAAKIIKKYGGRGLNTFEAEQLIKYIYNKLTDQPAHIDRSIFVKDCKVVFCPICCPDPNDISSTIKKATITSTGQQIYICKPCKRVWLTEDIRADNSQDYKKFMKSLKYEIRKPLVLPVRLEKL